MTKFYEKGATRMYSWDLIEAWAAAEENLGLKNSIFFKDGDQVTQWVDIDEGEKFHNWVKRRLKNVRWFDEECESYFKALEDKDLIMIFERLVIFNEIDEHPEIATEDQLRRLKRIRENTHEKIYNLNKKEGPTST